MKSKSTTPTTAPFRQLPVAWAPHGYQERAIKRMLSDAVLGLFLDPGLGKTSITLAALKILFKKKLVRRALVVAPLRVAVSTWPAELQKWKDFAGLKMVVLHGRHKDALLEEDADIYVINPEGLDWLIKPEIVTRGKKRIVRVDVKAFKRRGFDVLVVDELTKFKNYASTRFKMMKPLLPTFARRYGLTGDPAANSLLDLFGQMYMLDEGRSLGRYVTHYRAEYFTQDFNGFSYSLQPDAAPRIYKRIAPVTLRMAAEDYLKLPQLIMNELWLDFPDANVRALYDSLQDDLLARLDNGDIITAKNLGIALGKCRQFCGGAIYREDALGAIPVKKSKRDWAPVHDVKVEALLDLVEELQGSPLLVVYEFRHELERLKDVLKVNGVEPPHLGSGVSAAKGRELEQLWNAGKLPVLLVHPESAAHGLNLQGAGQHIAWFTLTWNGELFSQLIDRLRRQGSPHTRIFNHMLLMRDTVDAMVLSTLRSKGRRQDELFAALKKLARSRRA